MSRSRARADGVGTRFVEIEGHKPAEEGLRPALREKVAADQHVRTATESSANPRLADEERRGGNFSSGAPAYLDSTSCVE